MNDLVIEPPEPRTAVMSCRITEDNKKFLRQAAKKHGVSESYIVNQVLNQVRIIEGDSNKGKPRRSN